MTIDETFFSLSTPRATKDFDSVYSSSYSDVLRNIESQTVGTVLVSLNPLLNKVGFYRRPKKKKTVVSPLSLSLLILPLVGIMLVKNKKF